MSNIHYAAAACWTALLDSSALVHRTLRKPTSAGIIFHQRARHLLYHATKTRAAHAKFWVVMAGVGQCTARTTSAFARPVSARTAVAHAAKRGVTVTQVAPVFCSLVTTHVGPRNAKMAGVCAPRIFVKRTAVARDAVPPMMLRGVTGAGSGTQSMCMQDTGGTCFFFGCDASRGPAHCLDNRCICTPGFCASSEGTCSRSACKTSTGGTCHVLSCDATRGPTECLNGWCMCSPGYCANEGRCVLERGETRWDAAAAIFEAMPANFSALDAHVGSGNMFAGSIWAVALALLLLPASLAIAFKISFKRRDVSASAMEHLLS